MKKTFTGEIEKVGCRKLVISPDARIPTVLERLLDDIFGVDNWHWEEVEMESNGSNWDGESAPAKTKKRP